jgi:ferredoxin-type protein NapH
VSAVPARPGAEAIAAKGWLAAHKWLMLRRGSQIGILLLFLIGPWFGIWIVKGNLNFSYTLNFLPLTDPYVILQSLLARQIPEKLALTGVVVRRALLPAGRRPQLLFLGLPGQPADRFRPLAARAAGFQGQRPHQPADALLDAGHDPGRRSDHRQHRLGAGQSGVDDASRPDLRPRLAWAVLLAVFLFDLFVMRHGWCGHLCPVGAFYSLIGRYSLTRIRLPARAACNDCMDCFAVCPEPQVIRPALKAVDGTPPGDPGSQLHQLRSLHRCLLEGCFRLRHPFQPNRHTRSRRPASGAKVINVQSRLGSPS